MKIGDFSQLTGVPVKTLRYYSDIGLLIPNKIECNNYRQYGIKQLSELNQIISLKDSGFTLSEIMSFSNNELTDDNLIRVLEDKLKKAVKEQIYIESKIANITLRIKQLKKSKELKMILENIIVPPFQYTLMGMIKGVMNHYGVNMSDAMLYGGSGQAFMINIHEELCPSGPYCWNPEPFYTLLKNLGIQMIDHGYISTDSTIDERNVIDRIIKEHLVQNEPCGMVNMEYQLIYGYDETGFLTSQPWSENFPPAHLTYSTWDEIKDEIHACFYTFKKTNKLDLKTIIKESLEYALDLNSNPSCHTDKPYYTGIKAYDTFIDAVKEGHGSSHGNWWNATVWAECREMASKYFVEISNTFPKTAEISSLLSADYKLVSEGLAQVSDKSIPIKPKIELLKEIKIIEESALIKISELIRVI